MKNKYYSLVQLGDEATINIYGDITSGLGRKLATFRRTICRSSLTKCRM